MNVPTPNTDASSNPNPSAPSSAPLPSPVITFKGSAFARWLLKLFGWQVLFNGVPGPHGVIAVYPHTSNWDFIVGILAKWSIGIPVRFWGKDSLFKYPVFGTWMRWIGGVPIARTSKRGMVADTTAQMKSSQFFWLALAPEGTRKRIAGWRSGFYRLVCTAQVPLGVAYFDYPNKTVGVSYFFMPTGDEAADMAHIASVLEGHLGCKPDNMSPIALLDPKIARDETLVVK